MKKAKEKQSKDDAVKEKKPFGQMLWQEWVKPFILIALVLGSLRSALADWNDVPTGSMKPTIIEGDRVVVNKLAYDLKVPFTTFHLAKWDNPQRGEIVVFYSPADGKRLVKRVIGVPGDSIEMRSERLLINGVEAEYQPIESLSSPSGEALVQQENIAGVSHPVMISPYIPAVRTFGPITVPPGTYFVMGDNRDNSFDSRFFGPVPRKQIVGRALAVAFSLDRDRWFIPRTSRFFEKLK